MYCIELHCIVLYSTLSHALKNTANQRPGLPLYILRHATDNISLKFPVIDLRAIVYWGPFGDFSKASSETL